MILKLYVIISLHNAGEVITNLCSCLIHSEGYGLVEMWQEAEGEDDRRSLTEVTH